MKILFFHLQTEMTESITIGLVGHVANGKTTLIQALTGINTRKNSHEKKTGRTTKLGYANCLLWKCLKCQHLQTSSVVTGVCCDQCKKEFTASSLVKEISFIDCPGHQAYVMTMARGGAVMDAAIIVTDCRSKNIQTQTLEHLAILDMLEIDRVLVVQNKVDLSTKEQCLENYHMLQEELLGTVAENAPIIPISAQQNLNMPQFVAMLYQLVMRETTANGKPPVLPIIRSFDINKPGTELSQLKGGVLGVVDLANAHYQIGEVVEIRPGLLVEGKLQPLFTKIGSIFSENIPHQQTRGGVLYGIGTNLDPTLTKNDRLIGSLAGRPSQMPPIVTELEFKFCRLKDAENLVIGNSYKIIMGIKSVIGKVSSKNSKIYKFAFNEPICTIGKKCLFYSTGANSKLLGVGLAVDFEKMVKIPWPEIKYSYDDELALIEFLVLQREKIPIPKLGRENRNIIWVNASSLSEYVHRPLEEIAEFFHQELLSTVNVCQNGLRFYQAKLTEARVQKILKNYLLSISCFQCQSVVTDKKQCLRCHATIELK